MKSRLGMRAALVLLVLLSALPLLVVVVEASLHDQKIEMETARAQLQVQAQLRAHNQERLLEGVRHMLKVISHAPPIQEPSTQECSRYLRELHGYFPGYAHLAFADSSGRLVCRSSTAEGSFFVGDREYFKGALRSGNFTVGEYLVSRITGKASIALSSPVYDSHGAALGVMYAVVELSVLQSQLEALSVPSHVTNMITDAEGVVLAAVGDQRSPAGRKVASGPILQAIRERRAGLHQAVDEQGREWIYAVQPVNAEGAGGLAVASIMSAESVLKPTVDRLRKELIVLVGIILAAALLAWHLGDRLVARPIQRILARLGALQNSEIPGTQPSPEIAQVRELRQIDRRIDDLAEALASRSLQRNAAMSEIQEQKRQLEDSERRYRAQFEASPQPMWVFDTQTLEFLSVNDAAVMHYGYSREEFMALTVRDICTAEDLPLLMETLRQYEFEPVKEILRRHRRKNGEIIDVELSTHALSWNGRPARVAIVYDVTSRETARKAWRTLHETLERKVAQRTRDLELAIEELEAFSYSVSHDLRGPLHVIDAFCSALTDKHAKELPQQARHYVDRIRAGVKHMTALIEDLLLLSKSGRSPISLDQVNLTALTRNVADQLQLRDPARRVKFEIADDLHACCDEGLMTVMLDNLVGNAWKFTSRTADATIRVGRVQSNDEEATFFVSDNGAGFDMEYAEKLFKPFERLHSTSEFDGTGIGLAIVNRIIHRHGGRIWAQGEIGKGAAFYFRLPAGTVQRTDPPA